MKNTESQIGAMCQMYVFNLIADIECRLNENKTLANDIKTAILTNSEMKLNESYRMYEGEAEDIQHRLKFINKMLIMRRLKNDKMSAFEKKERRTIVDNFAEEIRRLENQ